MIFKNGNFLPQACKLEYTALVSHLAICCHALCYGLTFSNCKPTMNSFINQTQKSTYKKPTPIETKFIFIEHIIKT